MCILAHPDDESLGWTEAWCSIPSKVSKYICLPRPEVNAAVSVIIQIVPQLKKSERRWTANCNRRILLLMKDCKKPSDDKSIRK
jgi:hypothetical protein